MPIEYTKILIFSGSLAILFSTFIGVFMLYGLQAHNHKDGKKKATNKTGKKLNFKHMGAAHIDWIMLGLMQGLAGGLIWAFALAPPMWVIAAMIFGGWINPLPYVFRAFGINAFVFAGGFVQRSAAALGGLSSLAIIIAWSILLYQAAQTW